MSVLERKRGFLSVTSVPTLRSSETSKSYVSRRKGIIEVKLATGEVKERLIQKLVLWENQ